MIFKGKKPCSVVLMVKNSFARKITFRMDVQSFGRNRTKFVTVYFSQPTLHLLCYCVFWWSESFGGHLYTVVCLNAIL